MNLLQLDGEMLADLQAISHQAPLLIKKATSHCQQCLDSLIDSIEGSDHEICLELATSLATQSIAMCCPTAQNLFLDIQGCCMRGDFSTARELAFQARESMSMAA